MSFLPPILFSSIVSNAVDGVISATMAALRPKLDALSKLEATRPIDLWQERQAAWWKSLTRPNDN